MIRTEGIRIVSARLQASRAPAGLPTGPAKDAPRATVRNAVQNGVNTNPGASFRESNATQRRPSDPASLRGTRMHGNTADLATHHFVLGANEPARSCRP